MSQIELSNVGPIEHLSIPVPEGGGVVVLKGKNGSGKSHAINGVNGLVRPAGRKSLRSRDGSPSGSVEGLGVSLRLGRSNRASGELECESIDASCDPSLFVDPGIKDPEAADRKRLETLVRLAGITVGGASWQSIFDSPEQYSELVNIELYAEEDDPVVIADRLRRHLHGEARRLEKDAKQSEAVADAVLKDYDVEAAKVDVDAIYGQMQNAWEVLTKAKADRDAQLTAQRKAADAAILLEQYEKQADSVSKIQGELDTAERDLTDCNASLDATRKQIAKLREQEAKLSGESTALERQAKESAQRLENAKAAANRLSQLRKQIDETPDVIDEATIERLSAAHQNFAEAYAEAKQSAKERERFDRAMAEKKAALKLLDKAQHIRDIARSTDSILEAALIAAGFDAVKINDGRLCVSTDRGLEAVSDLSHGERWRLALDLAAKGVGRGGLIAVAQEGWESLDPENRQAIHREAIERHLTILTAQCDGGELRAEVFGE